MVVFKAALEPLNTAPSDESETLVFEIVIFESYVSTNPSKDDAPLNINS